MKGWEDLSLESHELEGRWNDTHFDILAFHYFTSFVQKINEKRGGQYTIRKTRPIHEVATNLFLDQHNLWSEFQFGFFLIHDPLMWGGKEYNIIWVEAISAGVYTFGLWKYIEKRLKQQMSAAVCMNKLLQNQRVLKKIHSLMWGRAFFISI